MAAIAEGLGNPDFLNAEAKFEIQFSGGIIQITIAPVAVPAALPVLAGDGGAAGLGGAPSQNCLNGRNL